MTWRDTRRTPPDRLLTNPRWRNDRKFWQQLRLPCARCGCAIDYDGPRYFTINGRRRINPRYLIVGHIVSRRRGRQLGWTDWEINARTNQQPECAHCSNVSGAREGRLAQQARRQPKPEPYRKPKPMRLDNW